MMLFTMENIKENPRFVTMPQVHPAQVDSLCNIPGYLFMKEKLNIVNDFERILIERKAKKYSDGNYDKEYGELYPEIKKADWMGQYLPEIKGKVKHHWSYREEHWKDVIYLTRSEHRKIHHIIIYNQAEKMFCTKDGRLLDTKLKHIIFINSK